MFLNLLASNEHKNLFMRLSHLIAISDSNDSNAIESENEAPADAHVFVPGFTNAFGFGTGESKKWEHTKKYIDVSEQRMLELFWAEIGGVKVDDNESEPLNLEDWQRSFKSDFFTELQQIVGCMSKDSTVKKQVMLSLADSDIDLSQINESAIEKEMLKIPELRCQVFANLANTFIKKLESKLFTAERKTIVFELVGIAYADGSFSEIELEIVKSVAEYLEVDSETLGEMADLVEKLNRVSTDALELIQE